VLAIKEVCKKMRQIVWAVCAIGVMLLCMAPALGFGQEIQILSGDGGIEETFSMILATGDVVMPLSVGTIEKLNGPTLDIASNTPYSVSAVSLISNQPAPSICHQAAWSGTAWTGGYLTSPFEVGVNGDSYQTMTKTGLVPNPVTIRSGSPEIFSQPLKFRQSVSVLDPVLPAGSVYKIGILISGAATP
jgi:hypothetical protein